MKFRGTLSEQGVHWLQRQVSPVFERLGKDVTVLLTPKHVTLLQDTPTTQGIRIHATFASEVLFEEYAVVSQNEDKICFRVNTSMLVRVLRSIEEGFDRVELRLVKRRVSEQDQQSLPFLNFSTTSAALHIIQDLPLSGKPLQPAELQVVEATLPARDNPAVAPPYFLDIQPLVASQLPAVVDRLKHINNVVQLSTSQVGGFHLQAETMSITLGSAYDGLKVLPVEQAQTVSDEVAGAHPNARLAHLLQREHAHQVSIRVRDLSRSLLCHTTKPDRLLCGAPEGWADATLSSVCVIVGQHLPCIVVQGQCPGTGISNNKGFVQLALQYVKPFTDRIDPGVVIHVKLPVQVET